MKPGRRRAEPRAASPACATSAWTTGTFAWERFCSGDLAPTSAFSFGALGTTDRIYLNGEETRPPFTTRHGSAWAHIVSGPAMNQTWELPHLGQASWENSLACPVSQLKTVVMCNDDSDAATDPALTTNPSELYVHVGDKQSTGSVVEKAGLVGGTVYGVRVTVNGSVVGGETDAAALGGSGTLALVSLGNAATFDGVAQEASSVANNITRLRRIEDGAWDVRPGFGKHDCFVTTATITTNSRLWHLAYTDIAHPELGGTIELLLDRTERLLDQPEGVCPGGVRHQLRRWS